MNQNILRRKIEILKKEADVVLGQWESAVSDEQREQLWRRLEQKQAQIAEAERGLG
jgi:primosomal protein N'